MQSMIPPYLLIFVVGHHMRKVVVGFLLLSALSYIFFELGCIYGSNEQISMEQKAKERLEKFKVIASNHTEAADPTDLDSGWIAYFDKFNDFVR